MHDWVTTGTLALGCIVFLYICRRALRSQEDSPLPPGPPGLPWVGSIIGTNTDAPWLTYTEWARTYGDLVHFRLLGKHIIVINSQEIAKDLFENRSKNYSDRPYFITYELCGQRFSSVFKPYGDEWRLHRRFFHQTFRLNAIQRFLPVQHHRACHFLQKLLETPEKLDDHIFEYTTSVILKSTYDYEPISRHDDLVDIVANVLTIIVQAMRPEISVVLSALPWLHYLPSWLPGMSFKKDMAVACSYTKEYLDRPFDYSVKKANCNVATSMVHDALRYMEEKGISPAASWMHGLKEAAGTAFLAASETSNSFLMTFFLMMTVNQKAQEKAQTQIDAVVGRDRLPGIDDRAALPFIDAILRETLRYSPVAPLVPRATVDDDTYNGYHIPKGAILLANLWSMAHDEARYPDSDAFIPERFLNEDGSLKPDDTQHIAFGFGRRMCVGRHFADTSVWAIMAKVLAVYKILRPLDENGVKVPVEPRFSTGVTVHPLPFRYRIVPRLEGMDAEKLAQLIKSSTP